MVRPGYTILRAAMDAFDHLVPGKRLHPRKMWKFYFERELKLHELVVRFVAPTC